MEIYFGRGLGKFKKTKKTWSFSDVHHVGMSLKIFTLKLTSSALVKESTRVKMMKIDPVKRRGGDLIVGK